MFRCQVSVGQSYSFTQIALVLAAFAVAGALQAATASNLILPNGTILPVRLDSTLSSKTSKAGQAIHGRLMQAVLLPNGSKLRAGTMRIDRKRHRVEDIVAHARLLAGIKGAAPIMLLDEVSAHLDAERRAALFGEIAALGTQAWLTGTEARLFDGLKGLGQFFTVANATIE